MRTVGSTIAFAATDLSRYLACRHLVELERAVAEGRLERAAYHDPALDVLVERGKRHEAAYVEQLRAEGRDVVDLREVEGETVEQRTVEAMRAGADVVVQAWLSDGRWGGIADLLLRVDRPSDLGAWSYEVADTKLARETRGTTVLQLCVYADLLAGIQGAPSEQVHVVKPGPVVESFRCADFQAYYRMLRRRLEEVIDAGPDETTYPEPVAHCDICSWWQRCDRQRRDDDHLCLVAGMQTLHAGELRRQGIVTLEAFAERDAPLDARPERGSEETFQRLHGQARIQLEGRRAGEPRHRLVPAEADRGFARLPPPSAGDVFFDIEADPFVGDAGLEYLLGWVVLGTDGPEYHREWALDTRAEKRAFEAFVDMLMAHWERYPDMHVYHYSPYETGALKRLMGRHATREDDVDRLLRGNRFVDLLAVTRQGLQASVEGYSLKNLEPFYGFERDVPLRDASAALRRVGCALELGDAPLDDDRRAVEGYNREDCVSTLRLRDWLEERRAELIAGGADVPRPEHGAGDASEQVEERRAEVQAIYDRLSEGLPEDRTAWTGEQEANWLLANLLDYFRREAKCVFWEMFRLNELDHDELLPERKALTGLRFVTKVQGGTAKCPVHRYGFPEQEATIDAGTSLLAVGDRTYVGSVRAIDHAARTVDIKKRQKARDAHPAAVVADLFVRPAAVERSLLHVAQAVAHGEPAFRAAIDLLHRRRPRVGAEGPLRRPGEAAVDAAVRLVRELDAGVLPIQGPPGSGKTYTGARMIARLAAEGKRIGVTAVSHKVIRKLLDDVLEAGNEFGIRVAAVHKPAAGTEPHGEVEHVKNNADAIAKLDEGYVVGGTCWLWSLDDAAGQLDYLFVDEAGQLSLAMTLAAARAARNLVLLGDPQQLQQPQQASHPEGADVSALEHLLEGRATIAEDCGLFLDRTWRLHPDICAFTSEVYYDGRLEPRDGLERQAIHGATRFRGSGLFFEPVAHAGNQNSSPEEVAAVRAIAEDLLTGCEWSDLDGDRHPLGPEDVLVVAPYNAQVGRLIEGLPDGIRVGTVDKFQGQEAPVVIYSLTSSSVEDAPRGMTFLYDPHRLNVATSRARCTCIVVGSPRLLEPECHAPAQMRWANALCRFAELARA